MWADGGALQHRKGFTWNTRSNVFDPVCGKNNGNSTTRSTQMNIQTVRALIHKCGTYNGNIATTSTQMNTQIVQVVMQTCGTFNRNSTTRAPR